MPKKIKATAIIPFHLILLIMILTGCNPQEEALLKGETIYNFENILNVQQLPPRYMTSCVEIDRDGNNLRGSVTKGYKYVASFYITNNIDGMNLYYSLNNSILNNYLHSNTLYGIYINLNSDSNIVSRNVCTENRYGIRFKAVSYNEIFFNRCENNELGIYSCCGSSDNILSCNLLIDNEKQASDSFYNSWDNGIVGNYWNDYTGNDSDGDGIGDTPYPIPDGNNEDRYPLMYPLDNHPPDTPVLDGPPSGNSGGKYCLIVHSVDPDGDEIYYLLDWGDGTTSGWDGPYPQCEPTEVCHKFNKGTYLIRAQAMDIFGFKSNWSDPLFIEIPRNKPFIFNFNLLCGFLDRFLIFERFQYLIKVK